MAGTDSSAKDERPASAPGIRARLGRLFRGWLDVADRTAVFTETAGAATDTGVPYWVVLVLAGGIAAFGLAQNSVAVVVGAMLIAPLLAPVIGLALALAIGDGRLAVEAALVVLLSTIAVIGTSALLALALPLPFQTLTTEIVSRTRPTTLDLAIAASSGLAGAVVTVTRSHRLSGAVPGVAVSVALVPPLAVTGYGIGTGWNWPIVRGSLLLYGANLAGIVVAGMAVFLLAGMRRPEVLEADREWFRDAPPNALTAWVERIPGLRSLGIMNSTWARLALVASFVALVAVPLRASLHEIARETRVKGAVDAASRIFIRPGHSFIVSRDVELGQTRTQVVLNVATTGWFGDSARREFQRRASRGAGEPVSLTLEQLPASSTDVSQLAALISPPRAAPAIAPAPASAATRIGALRAELAGVIRELALPDSVTIVGSELTLADSAGTIVLRIAYASPDSLSAQARQITTRQLAAALDVPSLEVTMDAISTRLRALRSPAAPVVDSAVALLARYPALGVEVFIDTMVKRTRTDSLVMRLRSATGPDSLTVQMVRGRRTGLRLFPRAR